MAFRRKRGHAAARTRSGPAAPRTDVPPPGVALGRAIRARRKELGLTQAALARYAGCGLAFLYELESGKATVRLDKVLAVLEILGLTLALQRGRQPLTVASAESVTR